MTVLRRLLWASVALWAVGWAIRTAKALDDQEWAVHDIWGEHA